MTPQCLDNALSKIGFVSAKVPAHAYIHTCAFAIILNIGSDCLHSGPSCLSAPASGLPRRRHGGYNLTLTLTQDDAMEVITLDLEYLLHALDPIPWIQLPGPNCLDRSTPQLLPAV